MCAPVCACVWCTAPTCCALVPFEVGSGWPIRTAKTTTQENTFHENKPVAGLVVERERDVTNAVPPHLRRDVFRYQAIWPPRVAVLFQFGRALLRNQRASPGSRSSGNPTDVRPRVAGLVVSQALWIRSLQVGRPRSTAEPAALMSITRHQFDSNSIPPDSRNGTLPTELAE